MKPFGPSWRTTLAGTAAILAAMAHVADCLGNGKPIDWTLTIGGITTGAGLLAARDNRVSSEDVGIKK